MTSGAARTRAVGRAGKPFVRMGPDGPYGAAFPFLEAIADPDLSGGVQGERF